MNRSIPQRKRGGGMTLVLVVLGVVVTLLGLTWRRTHTAASPHAVPAQETSAPATGSPGNTAPEQKSSSDRNG